MENNFFLDLNRLDRLGFPEVVYGKNKDTQSLINISQKLLEAHGCAYITRLQDDKFAEIQSQFSHHLIEYDPASGACIIGKPRQIKSDCKVAVISAGTSDEYVVNEALYTLKFLGIEAETFQDVGVAGLHRILSILDTLQKFDILIVVAGFEGALPTVLGGLVSKPIIAVPAAIGYGVAEGGKSALESMLGSCANGIMVMNIDNGYGAAIAAFRILKAIDHKIQQITK
ncbi:MAG: nickel pincer cofactor biosynthesis protein LarB [Cyclobacteriaceae bacterium]|nr:nickel pincer cofactor biosynthesis protein LarB [Cyclobacteriaceae bacterium]